MYEVYEQLDQFLARLAGTLRAGDHVHACMQLAELALDLDACLRREERALSQAFERHARTTVDPTRKIQREHASLRRLMALLATALDKADDSQGLDVIGKLRSVLLLHAAKEQALMERVSCSAR